jgi:hypothetical protein
VASRAAATAAAFAKNTVDTVINCSLHNACASFGVNFFGFTVVRFKNN